MYVNIGMDMSLRTETVMGIFDLDNTTYSRWTRSFLRKAEENGCVVEATDELPKSFVLTFEYGEQKVYLTRYNAAVLQKRFEQAAG